ncbi:MAG: NAD(P)H-hydrate dehydratase, partial [Mariprofundaceae bacterium]|nr:NAD(P)H-hydrate dehydratase [Mariprofundaceae bacterium]
MTDPENLAGAAAEHARRAAGSGAKIRPACGSSAGAVLAAWLTRGVLVVDAVFGTGLDRELQGWMHEAFGIINDSDRPVLAVDIASGIDSDSGKVMGAAIEADWTLPIAAVKWGHWLGEGRLHHGCMLPPADIGIDADCVVAHAQVLDESVFAALLPPVRPDLHKGSFGHVWVFGGSQGFTGAPRLAAMGATSVHAGLVSICCPQDVYALLAASCLEVMVHPQAGVISQSNEAGQEDAAWTKADAVVAGPGWGMQQQPMLGSLLRSDRVLLLDADALNMLAAEADLKSLAIDRKATTVFTPHPGEAARLLGSTASDVQQDRLAALRALLAQLQGWVVLKGAQTLIGSPDGRVWLCPFGSSRLATAGSGDVLSGMIAGLLGQGLSVEQALAAAVAL